ncbi:zinc-finger homeodomain protein 7 [Phtheirospermum japonicum]|uniref:Zinc-finger homeodomain protein 7 n=1 Tax=Phtheirospermum japonicum TaxID=374723 RepID=A0A830CZS0_9LAMI|nr:zinc-finger homeodomain protein 7 [Phtheirospermum japonicum]
MYKECQHNYAAHDRAYILDGCCLFEPSGPNGTPGSTVCVACNCHRSFHRRVEVELPRVTRHQNDDYGPVPPHQPISGITDLPPRPQVHVAPVRPMQDLNRPRVHRPTGLAPIFGRQQQGMEAGPGEHRKEADGGEERETEEPFARGIIGRRFASIRETKLRRYVRRLGSKGRC